MHNMHCQNLILALCQYPVRSQVNACSRMLEMDNRHQVIHSLPTEGDVGQCIN